MGKHTHRRRPREVGGELPPGTTNADLEAAKKRLKSTAPVPVPPRGSSPVPPEWRKPLRSIGARRTRRRFKGRRHK